MDGPESPDSGNNADIRISAIVHTPEWKVTKFVFARTAPRREDMSATYSNQHVILFNRFLFNCFVVLTGHVPPHRRTYKYSLLEPYLSSEPCSHSVFSSRCTSTSECAPPGVSHAPCLISAFRSGARGFGVSCGTAQCMQSARAGFSCGVEGGRALLRRTSTYISTLGHSREVVRRLSLPRYTACVARLRSSWRGPLRGLRDD